MTVPVSERIWTCAFCGMNNDSRAERCANCGRTHKDSAAVPRVNRAKRTHDGLRITGDILVFLAVIGGVLGMLGSVVAFGDASSGAMFAAIVTVIVSTVMLFATGKVLGAIADIADDVNDIRARP